MKCQFNAETVDESESAICALLQPVHSDEDVFYPSLGGRLCNRPCRLDHWLADFPSYFIKQNRQGSLSYLRTPVTFWNRGTPHAKARKLTTDVPRTGETEEYAH